MIFSFCCYALFSWFPLDILYSLLAYWVLDKLPPFPLFIDWLHAGGKHQSAWLEVLWLLRNFLGKHLLWGCACAFILVYTGALGHFNFLFLLMNFQCWFLLYYFALISFFPWHLLVELQILLLHCAGILASVFSGLQPDFQTKFLFLLVFWVRQERN